MRIFNYSIDSIEADNDMILNHVKTKNMLCIVVILNANWCEFCVLSSPKLNRQLLNDKSVKKSEILLKLPNSVICWIQQSAVWLKLLLLAEPKYTVSELKVVKNCSHPLKQINSSVNFLLPGWSSWIQDAYMRKREFAISCWSQPVLDTGSTVPCTYI